MNNMKRLIVMMLVMVMMVTAIPGDNIKIAKAADYTSASDMAFTGTWSEDRWITEESGDHWYKLVIPLDGKVEFRMMSYIYFSGFEVYTEDFSQTLYSENIWEGSESQPTTGVYYFTLSTGIYYMKIFGDGGKYRINASYTSYGTNDGNAVSYDSPQMYSLGSQITGAITATDDEDWFRVTILSTAYYTLNVQTYEYRADINIYNEDLSKGIYNENVWEGSEAKPSTLNDSIILNSGIYYVKLSGTQGRYIFNLSPLNQSNCSHDYETKYVDPTYVSKGYQLHKCKLCGHSYMDNYRDKLQLGQVGTVYCTVGRGKCNLSWYSVSNSTGYQIRYSTNKSMKKSVKTVKVKGRTNKIIKKLRHRKKYYFQVRAYRKEGKQTVYGKWSKKVNTRIR